MRWQDRTAVVGIGQTRFAAGLPQTEPQLLAEAVEAACADAGLELADIDGAVRYDVEQVAEVDLLHSLRIPDLYFYAGTPSGGGGMASLLVLAALGVATGQAGVVLVYRSRKRSKTASYGAGANEGGRPWSKPGTSVAGNQQWHHPFGVAAPAQEIALIAQRHMITYGTRAEAFGLQAVAQRHHASTNPTAIKREPFTLDDWAASRPIAEPIRLFDCSLENDGAVALLVTSVERARDLRQPPAVIHTGVQGGHPGHYRLPDYFTYAEDVGGSRSGLWDAAGRLWSAAAVGPGDVDAAMVFDHFTPAVPLSLETWGFVGPGEGGPFIESGATRWPDGALPVNTHGGSTSEAFIHGVNHLTEAVRQIRGTAVNQVRECRTVFVCGAVTDPSGAVLLRRAG